MRFVKQLCVLSAFLLTTSLFAKEQFIINYFKSFDTLEADFTQEVIGQQSKEFSTGKLYIQKRSLHLLDPKFLFDYQKPYPQQLISNGKKLWDYDEDLMQVVIRPMSTINNNPLLIVLLGETELDEFFNIKVKKSGREFELTPRETSEGLEIKLLTVYFNSQGVLSGFSAIDTTGQRVKLEFRNVRQNPIFDDNIFTFKVPKGVDVIDETR